jgi:hypothetical protein
MLTDDTVTLLRPSASALPALPLRELGLSSVKEHLPTVVGVSPLPSAIRDESLMHGRFLSPSSMPRTGARPDIA